MPNRSEAIRILVERAIDADTPDHKPKKKS
jgi:hypothetical protein